ncbi:hypothetical protein A5717_26045 [Mycolicibacterium porcinum]|nr:hypothetical protein A5717_26045 [Mycolicibacterium porcinum]
MAKPVNPKVPPMPKLPRGQKWYPEVIAWWKASWTSEMRDQWADADLHMLSVAAKIMQQIWNPETDVKDLKSLAGEMRLISAHFGLTPGARKSLEWELPQPEDPPAGSSTTSTPRKRAAKKVAAPEDPRARFQVVPGGA